MPGVRNDGSMSSRFTVISSPALLLTSGIYPLNYCEALWSPVGGSYAAKAVCPLRWRFQPLCSQRAGELWDQHKLWQSGIINFPQPTTWNSWKDRLSLFLIALAGLNSTGVLRASSHCPPSLGLGFKFCQDKKEFSIYNYFFLKDEISYNTMMEVITCNSCLVSTHCLKLILVSTVFPSMCHFNSRREKLCFLMYYHKCDDTLLF